MVQGQVVTTQSAATREPFVVVVLQKVLGIGIAEAQNGGTPVEGATVTLTCDNGFTATTTTDEKGKFVFPNVPPGTCTVAAQANGATVTANVEVGAGDMAVVGLVTSSDTPPTVTVTAVSTDVVHNDAQLGHAVNIERAAHCDLLEVISLREQRHGWGWIARQCGAHPGVLGLGRSNVSDAELAEARERVKNGRAGRGATGGNRHGPKA